MNAKVRRYQPLFLSPPQRSTRSPFALNNTWKTKINDEVTEHYNQLKNETFTQRAQSPKYSKQDNKQTTTAKVISEYQSTYAQSEFTTQKKIHNLDFFSSPSISALPKTDRQRQIQNFYLYRLHLLQEQCLYLRKNYISHCLKHHKKEFQSLDTYQ